MISSSLEQHRQGVDYEEGTDVQNLHAAIRRDERDLQVRIKPFSLWVMVVCGLTIFFVGFCSSRYAVNFSAASLDSTSPPQSELNPQTVQSNANPARVAQSVGAEADTPAVVHIVMKNMKFDPATIEVKSGDTVEWTNEDITPHTATSAKFDSASIEPEKSWRHTFTEPGSFPYNCTFHPDMKAAVLVK